MPTYDQANRDVHLMVSQLVKEYHQPIKEYEVKIELLFAYADIDEKTGSPKGPAIKHHGIAALAVAKVNGLKDRARGLGDVLITIDADWWKDASVPNKKALLDHELQHFAATGELDKQGRPKVVIRDHDVEIGWFDAIARRHGVHSQERIQASKLIEERGQYYWPELLGTIQASKLIEERGQYYWPELLGTTTGRFQNLEIKVKS